MTNNTEHASVESNSALAPASNRRVALRFCVSGLAVLIAGCGPSIPDEIKPAVDHYHLSSVAASDLTTVDTSRALSQLARESCNSDAMGSLGAQLQRAGYRREAANALTQFVDQCGRADGFLDAAAQDLIAVRDYRAATAVADRLVQTDNINPQFYFTRGLAREGAQDYEKALADYMQAIALLPDLSNANGDLFMRAADMQAKAGRYCEAASVIRMWTTAEPSHANYPQVNQQIAAYAAHQSCKSSYAAGDDTFARKAGTTILVKALVNGVSGTFIVDTGATYVLLTRNFAHRAQVPLDTARQIQMTTVNGKRQALLTSASSIKVGRAEAERVELTVDGPAASSLGNGVDGLLGQSFLSRFQTQFTPTQWSIRPAALKG